jgi:hypothetical protein
VARAKGSISLAERAARAARERSRDVWRMVNFYRLIRERRGILTLAQILTMSRRGLAPTFWSDAPVGEPS